MAAILWLFLNPMGTAAPLLSVLAKIQLIPAIAALNLAVVAGIFLSTLLLGRVYCSVICPLGILQDIIAAVTLRLRNKKKQKRPYKFTPANNKLRLAVLVLFTISMATGLLGSIHVLIAPYSSFGRIITTLAIPCGITMLLTTSATIIILTIMVWKGGRMYCNTICPAGTLLGLLSRHAYLRPEIDKNKCIRCKICETHCKSQCIDIKHMTIDHSRCVACGDCTSLCPKDAMHYTHQPHQDKGDKPDALRRKFLLTTAAAAITATLPAQRRHRRPSKEKKKHELAPLRPRKQVPETQPILPPGAKSERHFEKHCTACLLCVANCPGETLRVTSGLKPSMTYLQGYCVETCNKCSEICPTEAIAKIDLKEKCHTKIGTAVHNPSLCLPFADEIDCDNCAWHCPHGAITMVPKDASSRWSIKIPSIDPDKCTGCGQCEYLCPARPISAIHIIPVKTQSKTTA